MYYVEIGVEVVSLTQFDWKIYQLPKQTAWLKTRAEIENPNQLLWSF